MGKSKEKKRKPPPPEEVAEEKLNLSKEDSIQVKIKAISEDSEGKTSPLLGYFPSGYDPLKNSSESNSTVTIYKKVKSENLKDPRMELVVGLNGSNVNFVGNNRSGEATQPRLCNYALGVFDKETQTLKMVPIAGNRVFRLDPKVEGLQLVENEPVDGHITTAMYSTKSTIRRDSKRKALQQADGTAADNEEMDQKLKPIKINTEALTSTNPTFSGQNIPPYNLEAATPEMAFPLDQIILNEEWDVLLDIFELAQAGSAMDSDAYPSFVRNRFDRLNDIMDYFEKKTMAGILSYITHLIKFRDRHSMDGVSSAKRHQLPSLLFQKFSSLFSPNSKSRIPDDKQKLLISYVLVLSLFADNFQSDTSDIAKDLRMDKPKLRTYYEYLGCNVALQNNSYVATLRLPLQLKTIKRKRKTRS